MDVVGVEGEAAAGSASGVRAVTAAGEWEREPQPSDSLRTFGAVVQALREHAGLSRADLGARVQYSKHTVESVELGRRMPDETFVERAEEALGNTGALRKAARHLTRGEAGLAAWFRRWARLEREAVSLCTYECRLVPGLLQSEAYARAVFDNSIPLLTDEQTEAQVTARMERQAMMRERPTVPFGFIVEESVFRRGLGGPQVQASMLDYVLELTAPRNVTLQVVPLKLEFHGCLDGPVQLVETLEGRRLGYSEGQQNGRLISDAKEVSLLCRRYDTALAGPQPQGIPGPAGATARRAMNSGTSELAWFKSSYSGTQGDSCVEVAIAEQSVHVRDSKDVTRPSFAVGREGWGQFVRFASER